MDGLIGYKDYNPTKFA